MQENKPHTTLGKKILRVIAKLLVSLLVLLLVVFLSLWLLLKVPAVQNYVVHKATHYVSDKTKTRVELARVDIGFPKYVILEGLFLEDLKHDTLAYAQKVSVDIDMLGLINKKIIVDEVLLQRVQAKLIRSKTTKQFNFQFLLDAFGSKDKDTLAIKDTTGSVWEVDANQLTLDRCKLDFEDSLTGMFVHAYAGQVDLDIDDLDLSNQGVEIDDLLLKDIEVGILKTQASLPDTSTGESALSRLVINGLTIEQVRFEYEDKSMKTRYFSYIDKSSLKKAKIDLNAQTVALDKFELHNSITEVMLHKDTLTKQQPKQSQQVSKDWTVSLEALKMSNNQVRLDNQLPKVAKGIDYNHIALKGLSLDIEDIYYKGAKIMAQIHDVKVQEQSGLGLRSFQGDFSMDSNFVKLHDFEIATNHSKFQKSLELQYASLQDVSNSGRITCELSKSRIAMQELLWLLPALEKNEIIARNRSRVVDFECMAKGTMQELLLKSFKVNTSKDTRISIAGKLSHVTKPDQLYMDLDIKDVYTTASDVKEMLPEAMIPNTVAMPNYVHVKGHHQGTLEDFTSHIALSSGHGDAKLDAAISKLKSAMPTYDIKLYTSGFSIGALLKQSTLGTFAGKLDATGRGFDKENAEASVKLDVASIGIKGYDYKNIVTKASLSAGVVDVIAAIDDKNIALDIDGRVGIVPAKEYYKLNVNLKGIDLYRLGLNDKHIQVSAKVNTDIKGAGVKNLNGFAAVRDILIIKDNKEYRIDSLMVAAVNSPGKISTTVTSTLLTAQFNGNIDLLSIAPVVSAHLDKYFTLGDKNIAKPQQMAQQNFEFNIRLNPSPIVKEVFLPSLNSYETLEIKGGFVSLDAKLWADLTLPSVEYGGNYLEDLKFSFDTGKDTATYALEMASFSSGDIKLFKTRLSGSVADNTAGINLSVDDTLGAAKLQLSSVLAKAGDYFRFKVLPKGLKIKKDSWDVDENNFVEFGTKHLKVDKFKISNSGQSIALQSTEDLKGLKAVITHFELRTLSQIVEKKDSIIRGTLNGHIDMHNLEKDLRFTSDLQLNNLVFKASKVGDIAIKADNLTAQRYTVHAIVSGMGNDIDLSGYYNPIDKNNALNFLLHVKTLKLASFDSFSNKQISESSGDVLGKLQITGNVSNPLVTGKLVFKEAKTKVAFVNETLYMKEEAIEFSSQGISFMAFTLRDEAGNVAKINGDVHMKAFKDIKFNMDVSMRNFTVLNTSAIHNKSYYGKLILDSDIKVRGTPDLPKIVATVNVSKGSKFTVAVPESKVSVDRGEGVVVFLYDPEDLHPIMLRREDIVDKAQALKGMDLDAKIRLHPHTSLKILVDPYTGDSLVVRGKSDMNFSMDPSGKMSLSGIYTLSGGSYNAYIEGIMPKRFDLVNGSRIIWNGDPLDAQVDLSAKYNIRTSAAELMTIGGGTGTITDSSTLSRPLPFEVYLIMRGELLKPVISFRLDMPENQRSVGGGAIYGKVGELNQDEAELNKQVFSLLVLNKFLPASPTGSAGGGMSGFARSSVSRLMSDQLNQLSGQYLKGVEINFDVQSYNYSQGGKAQANTQVNVGVKKDFNRLSVQVGGNVPVEGAATQQSNAQNLTGDVQVGYKLTKDGRYKLKAFRQNQVDNVANGVITETGAGVLYSRDYNKTRELFGFLRRKKKVKADEE